MVYSPIVHCHPVALFEDLPREIEYWWAYNQRMIRVCDWFVTLCLDGWHLSKGVEAERVYAAALNKPCERFHLEYIDEKGVYTCPWLDSIIPAV